MKPRERAAALSVSALVVGMAATSAAIAGADAGGAIPDSAQMDRLRREVAKAPVLLARGDFGLREIRHPLIDSAGVRSARWESATHSRSALFAAPDVPRPPAPAPIPWREISSLEAQRQKKLQGAIGGGVFGLALGGLLASTHHSSGSDDYAAAGLLIGTPITGALVGTLVGSLAGTKTIYRAQPQENP